MGLGHLTKPPFFAAAPDTVEKARGKVEEMLLSLTLNALEESEKKIAKSEVHTALHKAYARNDEKLVQWLLQDSIREIEPFCLKSAAQFRITACIFATHLHHSFGLGHSPSHGTEPINATTGNVAPFYLSLTLSHRFSIPETDTPETVAAKAQVDDQLRVIRHDMKSNVLATSDRRIEGEPLLPVRYTLLRPGMQRAELYLRSSARGGESTAGWFAQSGVHLLFNLRVACRLQDRRLQVPLCLPVEEAVQSAKRSRDGTLRLPGRRAHAHLPSNTVAVTSVQTHSSISAAGQLIFAPAGASVQVTSRMCSVTFPMIIPDKKHVGIGVATRISGRKRRGPKIGVTSSKVSMEAGTVLLGCAGVAEVMVLLMDASVEIVNVTPPTVREVGASTRLCCDITFTTTRNGDKRKATLRCAEDILRHIANVRELGSMKLGLLYTKYVEHLKSLHKKHQEKFGTTVEFDSSRIVKNTWVNPLQQFTNLDATTMQQSAPPSEARHETVDGVITEVNEGFVSADKSGDPELQSRLVRQAMDQLSAAVQPLSTEICLPYPTETLMSR